VYGVYLFRYADSKLHRVDIKNVHHDDVVAVGGPCVRHACNYLVLGSDSRKGLSKPEQVEFGDPSTVPGQRSDTIMLVHVDPTTQHATVISFPRDLWVDIPHQGMGKITTAYAGGGYRVAHVITNLSGLRVNHFLAVDLAGFEGVVRALGSIPICIDRPLVDPTNYSGLDLPHAGCYDLDAKQALAFVRARHIECETGIPDFNRIGRQQQFLRAVLSQLVSVGAIFRAKSLIDEVAPHLVVDKGFDIADIYYLTKKLQGLSTGAVDFRAVPTTGAVVDGLDVLKLTPESQELFKRLREGKPLGSIGHQLLGTPPSPAVIRVRVYDHASHGRAQHVSGYLTRAGFDTASLAAGSLGQPGAAILYRPGARDQAQVVQGFLPTLPLQPVSKGALKGSDVAVVVNQGYNGAGVSTMNPAATGSPGSTGSSSCG
jgi:LCP family protein required for cell wall assembly